MRRPLSCAVLAVSLMAGAVPARASANYDYMKQAGGWSDPDAVSSEPVQVVIPRQTATYHSDYPAGTIVVSTADRRLYLITGPDEAIAYGIGVGRPGFEWNGVQTVTRKEEWPSWTPPAEMLKRRPDLPRHMTGGVENPLGARALYLGGTMYRIHGSNEPDSIGQAVSSGCLRMLNEDIEDLYERVKVGTKVIVL